MERMLTIRELMEDHARRAAEILTSYQDRITAIKEDPILPPAGAPGATADYSDRLSPEQRFALVIETKAERSSEVYQEIRARYEAEVARYHEVLARRIDALERELYGGLEDQSSAPLLAQIATSSNENLESLFEVAERTFNMHLAHALFIEIDRRDLAGLRVRYFELNPDAQELWAELQDAPPQELLDRQIDGIDSVVKPPDTTSGVPTPIPLD